MDAYQCTNPTCMPTRDREANASHWMSCHTATWEMIWSFWMIWGQSSRPWEASVTRQFKKETYSFEGLPLEWDFYINQVALRSYFVMMDWSDWLFGEKIHHNGWIFYLCISDLNISHIQSQIMYTGIYPRNKDYVVEAVFCSLEDGINALHKLPCSGDFEMLRFDSDWVCLLVFFTLWFLQCSSAFHSTSFSGSGGFVTAVLVWHFKL